MSSIQELVDISKKYKNRYIKNKEIEKEFEFIVNILKIDGINLIDALVYSIIYDIHNNYLNITDTIENEEYTDIDRLAWGKDRELWINIFFRSDDIQFISITGELELN